MKVRGPRPGSRRRPRIEMLPLIDIVFLLLVFFIYAMLSMAVHRGLPVKLPTSHAAEVERDTVLAVSVLADGTVAIDQQKVSLEELGNRLAARRAAGEDTAVQLFGEGSLSYQELFRVLDLVKEAGVTRISLQADASAE